MTTVLLIAVLVVLIGLSLILAANNQERSRRKYKRLMIANVRARQVIRDIDNETKAQLSAGNATFEQTRALLDEYRERESA